MKRRSPASSTSSSPSILSPAGTTAAAEDDDDSSSRAQRRYRRPPVMVVSPASQTQQQLHQQHHQQQINAPYPSPPPPQPPPPRPCLPAHLPRSVHKIHILTFMKVHDVLNLSASNTLLQNMYADTITTMWLSCPPPHPPPPQQLQHNALAVRKHCSLSLLSHPSPLSHTYTLIYTFQGLLYRHQHHLQHLSIYGGKTLAAFTHCLLPIPQQQQEEEEEEERREGVDDDSPVAAGAAAASSLLLHLTNLLSLELHCIDTSLPDMNLFAAQVVHHHFANLQSLSLSLAPLDLGMKAEEADPLLEILLKKALALGACPQLTHLSLPHRGR